MRVPDGTADVVLTSQRAQLAHGYRRDDKQDYSAEAFRQIYAMLSRAASLASSITACRRAERRTRTDERIHQTSTVRGLAEAAGFQLAACRRSMRTRRYGGLAQRRVDLRLAVAEGPGSRPLPRHRRNDRMTLKFISPAKDRGGARYA